MKVVVVGGGFAGINFIKAIQSDKRFEITLVDKNNYHFFPPLLYQVASAFIEPSNISYPFRRMFQKKENLRFHMGSLVRVYAEENYIETDTGTLSYDCLVLALGTETNYFGMESVQKDSLPMKSIDEALYLRNHILLNMEKVVRMQNTSLRDKPLNIVVAGGGPTGVEFAGMLAELGRYIAVKEYPEIKDLRSHIYLVNSGPVLLGPMSKTAQQEAEKVLTKLGVNVILNAAVKDYVDGHVILSNGQTIETESLIWATGVIAREVPGLPADAITRGRRIMVDAFNKVMHTTNIYAIGDLCYQTSDPNFPEGHPQLAQVAMQQGKSLAKNLSRIASNKEPKAFRYKDKGSMAIISKYNAVADLPKFSFKGFFAWLLWLFIHIIPLIGFRNKVKLISSWMWAFITNDPTLRLIFRPSASKRKK
ncbi:NAD(P)/FAD-dependent oxidoreductase [Olivibacter sp. XZL3]|uniref:NAD(P)/FAD-dependent oxidoreductase n=1 Tax=Olivibacter sp. XZL3 TaxID=1735116 RepID=UPI001064BD60|nr:NAD(P)/FAD-dependent oxidoreductase [Olivibacter sp. XZL3]